MSTGSVAFVGLANSACSSFLTALGLVLQQAARSADAAARTTDGGAAWKAKRGTYTATSLQVFSFTNTPTTTNKAQRLHRRFNPPPNRRARASHRFSSYSSHSS